MKKFASLVLAGLITISALTGCAQVSYSSQEAAQEILEMSDVSDTTDESGSATLQQTEESVQSKERVEANTEYMEAVENAITKSYPGESKKAETYITLAGNTAETKGSGVEVGDGVIYITESGAYEISGEYTGQIQVDVGDEDVHLILNGVTITSTEDSAIYIVSADEATITLMSGTENYIYDSSVYVEETEDSDVVRANGAIFSKDDLALNGEGALVVVSKDKSAIFSKDDLLVLGGTITVETPRDGIKGKDLLYIDDATFEISAGSDGLESEVVVYIDGGDIQINESYEGIEALDIVINDGNIYIQSSDDGINISGESDTETSQTSRRSGRESSLEGHGLTINGGQIEVNASGDGLDSNGDMWMNDGTVVVHGPTDNRNGSLDYNLEFIVTGGNLIAAGSVGMMQAPSEDSTLNALAVGFEETYPAGTTVKVINASDEVLFEYVALKKIQSIVVSSDALNLDETYYVLIDGEVVETVKMESHITKAGQTRSTQGGMPGMRGSRLSKDTGSETNVENGTE